ncbi:MAG: CotH kinase family protein [Bacteroidetes bacterium]|nr:CotH kinase family protein [Bacteroidota bacterium]MBM3424861.1 T9SS type A sorting domain-containing protein [Bacteroidota bacterium]
MRILHFFNFIFWVNCAVSQSFYDKQTVQTLEIFFAQANWDALLDNLAQTTEDYLLADSVRINGTVFDSVGVKYKGNSSYNPNNSKNPLHINLNWINSDADYQGYTNVKLQNGYKDPSMIREVLSYAVLENYMDCSKANFVNVFINGGLRGLYSSSESINDKFNTDYYYDFKGSFFKCNPNGGAGPGGGTSPDLKYLGSDSSLYTNGYELKSNYGWTDLVDLINTLNNNFASIEDKLDLDRAIWMLAFNNVLVNLDSYSGSFRQNYYLYKDLNQRFVPTVWDLNMSFNGFPGGSGSGPGSANLDPLSNINSNNHPLIKKILNNPMYQRMYMAHVRTMLQEMFASNWYLNQANALRNTINAHVQADPFKFYTYAQYQNSLTTAVPGGGPGGFSIPGIQTLMNDRVTYFNSNANYLLVAPSITAFSASNPTPAFNESFTISATASNETAVYLGYRTFHHLRFTRVPMYDDGNHGDGLAGDHIYGANVTANGPRFEYYLYADNNNAGIFSPVRAEHEFHTLDLNIPAPTPGQVQLNEAMSDNELTEDDPYGESNDWVELLNTTSSAVDLSGYFLSDDPANPLKWTIPSNTVMLPNSYLIVWTDNDLHQTTGLHANFKLRASGDYLSFSNGQTVLDQVTLPALLTDQSYARCPESGLIFDVAQPTFEAMNNCVAGLEDEEVLGRIYPNPFSDLVNIEVPQSSIIEVFDINGKLIHQIRCNQGGCQCSTENWNAGLYIARIHISGQLTQNIKIIKR